MPLAVKCATPSMRLAPDTKHRCSRASHSRRREPTVYWRKAALHAYSMLDLDSVQVRSPVRYYNWFNYLLDISLDDNTLDVKMIEA
ncbi:hypothetical protein BS78_05G186500 [Paspalum vaginatum]|nr:hypothetical protein BS78_05G186500 [Paspalum vaginatum]